MITDVVHRALGVLSCLQQLADTELKPLTVLSSSVSRGCAGSLVLTYFSQVTGVLHHPFTSFSLPPYEPSLITAPGPEGQQGSHFPSSRRHDEDYTENFGTSVFLIERKITKR